MDYIKKDKYSASNQACPPWQTRNRSPLNVHHRRKDETSCDMYARGAICRPERRQDLVARHRPPRFNSRESEWRPPPQHDYHLKNSRPPYSSEFNRKRSPSRSSGLQHRDPRGNISSHVGNCANILANKTAENNEYENMSVLNKNLNAKNENENDANLSGTDSSNMAEFSEIEDLVENPIKTVPAVAQEVQQPVISETKDCGSLETGSHILSGSSDHLDLSDLENFLDEEFQSNSPILSTKQSNHSEQFSSKEDDLPCSVASNVSDKKQSGKLNTPQTSVDYSYLSEILDKSNKQTPGSNQPVSKVKYEQPTPNKTSVTVDKNQKKKSKKTTRFTKKRSSTSNKKWRSPKRICSKSLEVDIKTENPDASQIKYPMNDKQNLSQSKQFVEKSGGQLPILNSNTQNPSNVAMSLSHMKEINGASNRPQEVGPQTKETVRKPSDTKKCENNVQNIENNVSPKNTTSNQPVNQPNDQAPMDASSGKAMFQDSQSSHQLQSAEPFQQRESNLQTSKQATNRTSRNTEPACLDLQALNADYALMNEYAPAEDCASLYLTSRKVTTGNENKPNSVDHNQNIVKRINSKVDESEIKESLDLLEMLLKFNNCPKVVMAADTLLQVCKDSNIQHPRLHGMMNRVSEMLVKFNQLEYLDKVIAAAVERKMKLQNRIIVALFHYYEDNGLTRKIKPIIQKISQHALLSQHLLRNLKCRFLDKSPEKQSDKHNYEDRNAEKSFIDSNKYEVAHTSTRSQQSANRGSKRKNSDSRNYSDPKSSEARDKRGNYGPHKSFRKSKSIDSETFVDNKHKPDGSNTDLSMLLMNRTSRHKRRTPGIDATDKSNLVSKFQSAASREDWTALGKNFVQLLFLINSKQTEEDMLLTFVGIMSVNKLFDASVFIKFDKAARMHFKDYKDVQILNRCLARIAISLVYNSGIKFAHGVIEYMVSTSLDYITTCPVPSKDSSSGKCFNAIKCLKICIQMEDYKLAVKLIKEFFIVHHVDIIGPVQGKTVCELLNLIAQQLLELHDIHESLICIQSIPLKYSKGMEVKVLEQILKHLLTTSTEENVISSIHITLDQLLNRNFISNLSLVRQIINNEGVANANVLEVYKYMENRGIYTYPKIDQFPHLVLIPHTMGLVEMSLALYRHLVELSIFLTEIQEKLKRDLPLRIVLTHNTGALADLSENKDKMKAYNDSENRLVETLRTWMIPALNIQKKFMMKQPNEVMINVDGLTVLQWMLTNTDYQEHATPGRHRTQNQTTENIASSVLSVLHDIIRKKMPSIP
uniref:uncharacterized protein LOC101242817 isoform X2 n=1 Tax=Ciona intestinalis TaxID=7719 RepID=UPI00089DD40E|nr:uncharacterized protein LOC101242817 isoform X2 [Ciona intestinalis]|eukprot:XP_018667852.1 uncharacterized protein LOC101242817 isoform X2 [Ciona intestinalis]